MNYTTIRAIIILQLNVMIYYNTSLTGKHTGNRTAHARHLNGNQPAVLSDGVKIQMNSDIKMEGTGFLSVVNWLSRPQ